MTKPKLQFRIPTLESVPEVYRQLYAPSKKGTGFELSVDGVGAPEASPEPPPVDKRTKAEIVREQVVQRVVARLGVLPEAREQVERAVRACVRVAQPTHQGDELGGEPDVAFLIEADGWRMPSHLADTAWAGEDEFVARAVTSLVSGKSIVQREWLLPEPAAPKSKAEAAHDDSEPLVSRPRNIRLPADSSQQQFEAAYKLATERGGEVLIDAAPAPTPTLPYRVGRDVPLQSGASQAEFERAHKIATSQGGDVVLIGEQEGPAEPTETDMRYAESFAAMHMRQRGR